MKKITLALVAILGFGLLFTSCTKKEYVDDGSGGQDLQAYTDIFTINPSDWTENNGNYFYGVNLGDFTKDIHDNGAYWAYISLDGGASYELLHTTINGYDFYATFDQDQSQSGAYGVTIEADPTSSDETTAPGSTIQIKVVSVPSSLNTSNVDFSNYNAVKSAFHLK